MALPIMSSGELATVVHKRLAGKKPSNAPDAGNATYYYIQFNFHKIAAFPYVHSREMCRSILEDISGIVRDAGETATVVPTTATPDSAYMQVVY